MTQPYPYKTALIGLGKMGMQNAKDAKLAQHYKYSSHIEALNDHPDFDCAALYDVNPENMAGQKFSTLEQIADEYKPEIIVLATPPSARLEIIKSFSNLKAIVIEKPVAHDYIQAKEIVDYCADNRILLQVNYWRRFDGSVIDLKANIDEIIGNPQVIFMTYGNGLRNNGVHLIDQIRYLFGDIASAKSLGKGQSSATFPIDGDLNIDFSLELASGAVTYAHALDFTQYREVGLDIWGSNGRVEFIQGGLLMRCSSVADHRALEGIKEIASDRAEITKTGASEALYGLYDNLSKALKGEEILFSDGSSALENERILDMILS